MRVLIHVQGLSGSGHVVRMGEVARALSDAGDVWLTDGGFPVPRRSFGPRVHPVVLPRIKRDGPGLAPLDGSAGIDQALADRKRLLLDAVRQARPDVLLVEHFPISKWNLQDEIITLIESAGQTSRAKVICSLRDISPRHRFDPDEKQHTQHTRMLLERYFDRVLVHADRRFADMADTAAWAKGLPIPIEYTGFVSEKPPMCGATTTEGQADRRGHVIVSVGGAGDISLASQAIAAWKQIESQGLAAGRTLVVFLPLQVTELQVDTLKQQAAVSGIRIEPFGVDFIESLAGADLSLSHAGYNTCMNLLETRTRALIAPIPTLADQAPRALRMAEFGLADVLYPDDLQPEPLASAMLRALDRPRPSHDFDLNGADRTRLILEGLL